MSTKGLEGVVVGETSLSEVYGEEGRLIYRGYEIEDLADNASFEEVCHLLWYGSLPDEKQLEDLRGRLNAESELDPRMVDILKKLPASTHPMAALRTAVSALSWFDPNAENTTPEDNLRKAIRLTTQTSVLSGAIHRVLKGEEPVAWRSDLNFGANLLHAFSGEVPDELSARVMDAALILHAEHGMNASTFSARVTVATLSDLYSGATSAVGTLKGPLHGGANEGVMKMLLRIDTPEKADDFVRAALEAGEKISGFGHRIYRTLDPRAPVLKVLAEQLAKQKGTARWLEIAERVQVVMAEEMTRRNKRVYPNVDFFSAPLYFTMGIPTEHFTNIFACARMPGWTAHMLEQLANNRLIRPGSTYIGPQGQKVTPIAQR